MTDTETAIATGSLISHVADKLGGDRLPNACKKARTILYDISTEPPGKVPLIVRDRLAFGLPPQRAKLVLRAAGSVLAGHALTRHYVNQRFAINGICEQSIYEADDGFTPDAEQKSIIKKEIAYGWKYPWRQISVKEELRQRQNSGRPSTSDHEIVARFAAGWRAAERSDWAEAGRIATNLGQVLGRRTKAKER